MSRIEPRQGPFAAAVAMGARKAYGRDLESVRVFARHPRLMFAWMRYNRAAERTPRVPKLLAELAVTRAATMVGCEFCMDISSEFARRAGLTEEQLTNLHDAHAAGLFSDDQLMVIDLATGMSTSPGRVDDELMERVQARFGTKGTMELVQLIAWENARARMNVALGMGAEGFSTGKACAVPYAAQEDAMQPAS
ncbi:MAG TPA: carboxymuconolactone decarboxylase family protein [Solirubrobacterales bacterium]|jgi:4-carboxymuconolactone decarboxylase|nr:carboxymuconolactone decarboxylase family protein [Solirubrobacterales bacterium]